MGVTGLWKLIEPCGRPVPVETLEGKILAVDVSIWLHQVVKGFQDSKGSALPNAHLLGLFHRLCKLLYYRVRPVFVFDGCVPQLKQDTIVRRQQQRSKLNSETERIQALLLQSLANEKVVQQALGANAAELLLKSPSKRPSKQLRGEKEMDDLFKLPELPSTSTAAQGCGVADEVQRRCDENNDGNDASFASESGSAGSADSSFEESSPWNAYNTNLQAIDVRSQHFRNLPAEVRHDILVDIKETRKQSSWGRLHELPSRSDDFSSFQMKRLLKRRAVQESLEEAEQEMGGCALTYTELRDLFTEEGIIEPSAMEKNSKQICSDENTRFLLVRDLKKKLSEVEEKPKMKLEDVKAESTPSQGEADREDAKDVKAEDELGNEYDADLQLAMALSLEDPVKVYSNEDYEYESNENLRLNREQRKQLKNAAIGPARAYMIEYGGMNDDEVMGIMDKTQVTLDEDLANVETTLSTVVASEVKKNSDITTTTTSSTERLTSPKIDESDDTEIISNNCLSQENESLRLHVTDDSETDSDFEDVPEEETIIASQIKSKIAIVLDVKSPLAPEDDLFADIFEAKTEVTIVNEDTPLADDEANNIRSENSTEECKTIVKDCLQVKSSKDCKSIGQLNDSKLTADDGKASKEPGENSLLLDKANVLDGSMSGDTRHEIVTATEEPCKALLDPGKVTTLSSILDELKKKAEEVKKINLDDVSIVEKGVIEISDDEPAHNSDLPTQTGKTEFIEIVDSDEGDRVPRKSPNLNTPSKNKSIIEYFETKYVVVRTPEKEGEESVPKVKSPFFVKKSPRSGGKRSTEKSGDSPTPAKKACKASKSLFDSEAVATGEDSTLSKEVALNAEDVMQEAARILKSQKNTEELKTLAADLAQERKDLESERNRQDRMGMSISQRMSSDCQQLLRLFGIPYIVAPMEAEAQCAFLDAVELTNGTITDDSDIWLFGGRTVYKNFFEQNKHVLEYHAERIKETFKCDRKKLIQLACLVGSDYTTGVHGIGTVTGLEILASFSSVKETDEIGSEQSATAVLSTLCRFRDWWQLQKSTAMPPGSTVRLNLRKKLKNIELSEGFPSSAVIEAYLRPKVDDNRDPFKWGCPDVESIREFTRKTFGWTTKKTDDILMPVMKHVNEKRTQASIRNYFTTKGALLVREPKVSKRVQKAIETLTGQAADSVEAAKPMTRKRAKRKQTTTTVTTSTECDDAAGSALGVVPSTSGVRAQVAQRRARIPDTKQVIPQRERNLELMQRNKEKAAALLRGAKSKMAN